MISADTAADRKAPDVIAPEEYERWRESFLGALTERIEEDVIFRLTGDLGGKSLLDLGCGDGAYSIAAFQRGARVSGVDISDAMLESARRRATACDASVEWHRASAESLPFGSGKFDIILAVTILCFIKDPLQVVREISRVLRPGGSFIIGELGKYSAWALSRRRVRGWFGSSRWRDAHFWSFAELRHLLQRAGFNVGPARGCVYYPPFGLAPRIVSKYDGSLSFLGQIGPAFLAVSGNKPALTPGTRSDDADGL
jgi:ubiquinone/menaquinone biosynthesis C-methylase UbiE